ncbi:hypothetical protein A0H81_09049 [Grifola frondosa]|uniref:Uncharacterized protein n=1 Tax=Grifola frondosa TaxID=5627 RepID=A0A1C7M2U6_GRIFR|nr:hypothetical protein A0H81_09049 [Grifola frondosa]
MEGFEDEDMELQAALQASLMGPAHDFADAPSFVPVTEYSGVRTPTQQTHFGYGALARQEIDDDSSDNDVEVVEAPPQPLDPVAESAARNRIIMERARRAQEAALREGYQEEAARVNAAAARRRQAGLGDDDDEMMRRAIAESEAMARAANAPQLTTGEEEDEDEEMADADDEPPVIPPRIPPAAFSAHRNYDDEDAELQAALKASLEGLPAGFKVPSPPPVVPPPLYRTSQPVKSIQQVPAEETSETDTESEAESSGAAVAEETLSIEEIRRRRLARFGG